MRYCLKCRSENVHRSRSRSSWERWRKEITGKRPFRCHACGWRGWAVDTGPRFREGELELASRDLAPEPPNLKRANLTRHRRRPLEGNLDALDVWNTIDQNRP